MKKFIITGFLILYLYSFSFSQFYFYQQASLATEGRSSGVGCAANGKGYMGLGQNDKSTYVDDFWEYDTAKNAWTQKTSFPGGGRVEAAAYTIKNKIYICFGSDNSRKGRNDIWEYDPSKDIWKQKSNLPAQGRYGSRGFVIGDSVLFIGTGSDGGDYLSDFWMYNPRTDKWIKMQDFAGGSRHAAASFTIGEIGYFGSGISNSTTPEKDFWKYDPKNDSWTEIASLPYSNFNFVSFVLDSKGYVGLGGSSYPFVNNNVFYIYDVSKNKWDSLVAIPSFKSAEPCVPGNLSTIKKRRGVNGFVIGDVAYFGTGYTDQNRLNDFWSLIYDRNKIPEAEVEDMNIYPNPATTNITVTLPTITDCQKSIVLVYNSIGQLILQQSLVNNQKINIDHLSQGLYVLRVYSGYLVFVKKISKLY